MNERLKVTKGRGKINRKEFYTKEMAPSTGVISYSINII